uniref:Zinc finger and BTB domain containing 25 n=2 Tax=Sus scrofa TaxID=9823 RepID=A0A287ADV6_PIG
MDTASHSLVLLQQLNMQREFGFLCDCTVAIGDVYFKAHRAVLAAFSNYFKMIFIHQTRKRKISCTICGHKFLRKSQLLEHMYTHKAMSANVVFLVLRTFTHFLANSLFRVSRSSAPASTVPSTPNLEPPGALQRSSALHCAIDSKPGASWGSTEEL